MHWQTKFPKFKSSHSFAFVTFGGTRVKAKRLGGWNTFTQRTVQMISYVQLQ
jgi:hypothetical protein